MSNPLMNAVVSNPEEKPTHYINLVILDDEGNKYRINTGIPLGGKYEKKLSAALIAAFNADSGKEFKQVGTINSATTVPVENIKF